MQGGVPVRKSISKEFRAGGLLLFSMPSIIMMIFMSLYTIVDGFFVARYVGTAALSAVNITYPLVSLFVAVGVMLATGGSAITAKRMGEGHFHSANQIFSLVSLVGFLFGAVGACFCLLFLDPILSLMGANSETMSLCQQYAAVLLPFMPMSILQMLYQNFLVTASRPGLGLWFTISAGISNMVLDYVFIAIFNMGIAGAAWATIIGYCVPAIGGTIFFFLNRTGLHFCRPTWDGRALVQSCGNGSSEMVTNLSASITTLLFNLTMMEWVGTEGVAAITVIMYAQFLMTAFYLGYSIGVAPVFSFHYGAENRMYLRKLKQISLHFILFSSIVIFLISFYLSEAIAAAFSQKGTLAYDLICRGMALFSFSFLFSGINIFASGMFTALSDGKTSAFISFSRTFVFILLGIFLMTALFQLDGLWLAIPFAELITLILSIFCIHKETSRGKMAISQR